MKLTSPAFKSYQAIPVRFTGEGEDLSPPLEWSDVPKDCKEFALICEDPDAPLVSKADYPFCHWIIYGLSSNITFLPLGTLQKGEVEFPVRCSQGLNSFQSVGYRGPMPPKGDGVHHYVFKLYALRASSNLLPLASVDDFFKGIQGRIITTAELIGAFERELVRKTA